MALDFLKTAGHCMHDITGNRFTPKQSYGRHINSKSVAVVTTITAAAALLTTKQDGNRRGAEAHYKNLKLRAWGEKKEKRNTTSNNYLKKAVLGTCYTVRKPLIVQE
jgi:hypothetical protein